MGQPRDRNTKASYVIVEDDHVRWRRVEYDIDAIVALILKAGLPQTLANRLKAGK